MCDALDTGPQSNLTRIDTMFPIAFLFQSISNSSVQSDPGLEAVWASNKMTNTLQTPKLLNARQRHTVSRVIALWGLLPAAP